MSSAANDPIMAAREDGTQAAPIMEQKLEHPTTTAHAAAVKRGHSLKRLLAVLGGMIFLAALAGIIALGVKMNQTENKYHALSEKYSSVLSQAQAARLTRMIPRHDAAMAAMEGDMTSTAGVFGVEINTVVVTVDLSTTVTVAQSTSTTAAAETHPEMSTLTASETEDVVTLSNTDDWNMPTASPWIDPAETFTEDWETTTTTTLTNGAPAETASTSSIYQSATSAVSDHSSVSLAPYTLESSGSAGSATTSAVTTVHLTTSATVVVSKGSSSSSSSMIHETSSAAALSGSVSACTCTARTETVWVPYTETVDNIYTQTVYVSVATAHTTVDEGTVVVTETVPTETVSLPQPYPASFSSETTTTTVTVATGPSSFPSSSSSSETSSVMPVSHDLPPLATATWHGETTISPSSEQLSLSGSSTTSSEPTATETTMTSTRMYTFTVGTDHHVTTVTLPPLSTAPFPLHNNSNTTSVTAAVASSSTTHNTVPYFLNSTTATASTGSTSTVTVVRGSGTAGVLAVGGGGGSTPAFGSPISLAAPGPKGSIVASGGSSSGKKIQGRGNNNGGGGSGTPVMGCVVMLVALALVVV